MASLDFAQWLQAEMERRGLDQTELARRAQAAGYPLARNSISRILTGDRDAGVDACISIAHALRVPREEVFRVRGWLLREPEQVIRPGTDPKALSLAEQVSDLPAGTRARVLESWESTLRLAQEATGQRTMPYDWRHRKVYSGISSVRNPQGSLYDAFSDGKPLTPYQPGRGFGWGYGGEGSWHLAESILLDYLGEEPADWIALAFKDEVIMNLPMEEDWLLTGEWLAGWIHTKLRDSEYPATRRAYREVKNREYIAQKRDQDAASREQEVVDAYEAEVPPGYEDTYHKLVRELGEEYSADIRRTLWLKVENPDAFDALFDQASYEPHENGDEDELGRTA